MNHIVLLGDSIFDNGAYVDGGIDVVNHLRKVIPSDWKASLRAVDGSLVADVRNQIASLPQDATHLVVSAGGNDAIDQAGLLDEEAKSAAYVLNRMAHLGEQFQRGYQSMLTDVLSLDLPTTLCTVYYPPNIERAPLK